MSVRHLLLVGLLLIPWPSAAKPFKWWQSADVQRELRLTRKQVAALDSVFDGSLPERRALRAAFDKCEFEFEQLLKERDPDERLAVEVTDRLEQARARRNVRRTMLLLQMRRILTPAQRIALDNIAAQQH
jgi:Spy/CpxP family protein refolding chaperone